MYALPLLNFNDFEHEINDGVEFNQAQHNPLQFLITENTHPNISPEQSMENVGNVVNSEFNTEPNPFKFKETQYTAIQNEKSTKTQYTETLAVFQRIYSKIVTSYLVQISSPERKSSKKSIYFDRCELFTNLQIESSFTTLKQVINRSELQFSQKSNLLSFLDTHNQLRSFLSISLSNGYEEINNEFIQLIFDITQELKTIIFKSQQKFQKQTSIEIGFKEKEKEGLNSLEEEKLMKKQLQQVSFLQRIFYEKKIRFLNCQQISSPVSDERVKQAFIRFARLYSHLIIKLIIMDMPLIEGKKNKISMKIMNSCQERLSEIRKQGNESKNKNSCQIIGNWFLNSSIAKSFNSINSLGSIHLNNLNDVKIYSSKPDLWSEADQDQYHDFSDDEFEVTEKRKT